MNSHSLFCFIEGYDYDYYYDKVAPISNGDFEFIKCDNKTNTLEAHDMFFRKYKGKVKMAFFIDRDFDKQNKSSEIYETEGYSIENYYCSWDVFSKIVEFGLHVNRDNEDWKNLKQFYEKNNDEFHNMVGEFNAFYSLLRKFDRENGCMHRCCLDDKFDKKFGEVKINGFSKKYSLQNLFDKYTDGQALFSQQEVIDEENRLRSEGASKRFRGKYELQFLYIILTYLIQDANKPKTILKNSSIKMNICLNTIMGQFSKFAYYPESLKQYLNQIWNGRCNVS